MKTSIFFCLSFICHLAFAPTLGAQSSPVSGSNIFSRLQQYESLEVVIETDLRPLKMNTTETSWQPGVLRIMKNGKVDFEQKVQVAPRGNMRRKICEFPPVKIRFYEDKMENDSLEDVNELKMVVACRSSKGDDQLVLKEYLAYKLYNEITDESFRVKLAEVKFVSPDGKRKPRASTAFFIESEQELATRLGGKPIKPRVVSPTAMDSLSYDRMCLFQFMIGNTDWGAYTRHNMKVIVRRDKHLVAVPYDFDYSGLVLASYAVPSEDVPIATVKDRYYLGLCRNADSYDKLFAEFRSRQDRILQAAEKAAQLDVKSKRHVSGYLNDFFSILADPKKCRLAIVENCDKRIMKK